MAMKTIVRPRSTGNTKLMPLWIIIQFDKTFSDK